MLFSVILAEEPGGGATRDNNGCMYAVKLQSYGVTGKTGILPPVTTTMSCNETLLKQKFVCSTVCRSRYRLSLITLQENTSVLLNNRSC